MAKVTAQCSCGRTIKMSSPYMGTVVGHGHCKVCDLEWHLTADGRFYSHPIRRGEPKVKEEFVLSPPITIQIRHKDV